MVFGLGKTRHQSSDPSSDMINLVDFGLVRLMLSFVLISPFQLKTVKNLQCDQYTLIYQYTYQL